MEQAAAKQKNVSNVIKDGLPMMGAKIDQIITSKRGKREANAKIAALQQDKEERKKRSRPPPSRPEGVNEERGRTGSEWVEASRRKKRKPAQPNANDQVMPVLPPAKQRARAITSVQAQRVDANKDRREGNNNRRRARKRGSAVVNKIFEGKTYAETLATIKSKVTSE